MASSCHSVAKKTGDVFLRQRCKLGGAFCHEVAYVTLRVVARCREQRISGCRGRAMTKKVHHFFANCLSDFERRGEVLIFLGHMLVFDKVRLGQVLFFSIAVRYCFCFAVVAGVSEKEKYASGRCRCKCVNFPRHLKDTD